MNFELGSKGFEIQQQTLLKVYHKGELVRDYFTDILVENEFIIEVKAVKQLDDIPFAQCLNYLRITCLKLCLLIKYDKPGVEIKRIVNGIGNY